MPLWHISVSCSSDWSLWTSRSWVWSLLGSDMGSAGYGVRLALGPVEALPRRPLPPQPAVHWTAGQALVMSEGALGAWAAVEFAWRVGGDLGLGGVYWLGLMIRGV